MAFTSLRGWAGALSVYRDRRQFVILLMGFSSGLPLLLGFSTLSYWLDKEGVSLATIGGLLSVSTPYALKFLWAPVFDHVRLPVLTNRLGQRRGWLLALQLPLLVSILALGAGNPRDSLLYMAAAALSMAFFSASQDVVVDAYRIEILGNNEEEQGAGASTTQVGYRAGLLVAGAGAIAFSDFISWFWIYAIMASFVIVGIIAVLIADEPIRAGTPTLQQTDTRSYHHRILGTLRKTVVEPISEFIKRSGVAAIWIVLFILFYKYGDAIAGAMSYPFYRQLGFTGVEIAGVTKVFGICMAAAGAVAGGLIVIRVGVLWGLLVGGVLQAVTNLLFAYLATRGADLTWLAIAIGADNFTGGLGSAAFVAFLSRLCNVAFTATQFALFTSLMALSRIVFAIPSGWLVEQIGWVDFFVVTTVIAIPALLLLIVVRRTYASVLPAR